jgi:hypothetical protein
VAALYAAACASNVEAGGHFPVVVINDDSLGSKSSRRLENIIMTMAVTATVHKCERKVPLLEKTSALDLRTAAWFATAICASTCPAAAAAAAALLDTAAVDAAPANSSSTTNELMYLGGYG